MDGSNSLVSLFGVCMQDVWMGRSVISIFGGDL